MGHKIVISLGIFVACLVAGGWFGVRALIYLCEKQDAIPGHREYIAGAFLGAVSLVLTVAGIEKLFSYAAGKYTENKAASKPQPDDYD